MKELHLELVAANKKQTTMDKEQNIALLLQVTQLMEFLVAQNNNQLTQKIYNDFLQATTIKEKIMIAEAFQDLISKKSS